MRMSSIRLAVLTSLVAGAALGAQAPAAGPATGQFRAGGARAAQQFLANTGALQLTDQQVVRLAAIARRSEARGQAQRASMDSMRARMMAAHADSAARAARRQQAQAAMRSAMERRREQDRADLRDALTVLTPDQQARAWEMSAARGRPMRTRGGGAAAGRGMRREMTARESMRGRMGAPGGPTRPPGRSVPRTPDEAP